MIDGLLFDVGGELSPSPKSFSNQFLVYNFIIFQILEENNILQDGTLIDLCGATLLWRSAAGLSTSPVGVIDKLNFALPF